MPTNTGASCQIHVSRHPEILLGCAEADPDHIRSRPLIRAILPGTHRPRSRQEHEGMTGPA